MPAYRRAYAFIGCHQLWKWMIIPGLCVYVYDLHYSLKRHQLTVSESIHFIDHRKGLAIANGLLFYLMHLILVFGWIFAPAYAVIAAILSVLDQNRD